MKEKQPAQQTNPVRQPAAETAGVSTFAPRPVTRKGRERGKPSDETLEAAVRAMVSKAPGSAAAQAALVYRELARHVDTTKELGMAESGGHVAATATWSEGTFVIDTTSGQFGGPDVFIGSVDAWREMIAKAGVEQHSTDRKEANHGP